MRATSAIVTGLSRNSSKNHFMEAAAAQLDVSQTRRMSYPLELGLLFVACGVAVVLLIAGIDRLPLARRLRARSSDDFSIGLAVLGVLTCGAGVAWALLDGDYWLALRGVATVLLFLAVIAPERARRRIHTWLLVVFVVSLLQRFVLAE